MRLTVSEMAQLCSVSVRTLHHYDHLGLLHPGEVAESGYRYYGENEICRLRQILYYRELDFSLQQIRELLSAPNYDAAEAMRDQRVLLEQKRRRLDRIIALLDEDLRGGLSMNFGGFDAVELEQSRKAYVTEAKQRWGNTQAWQESEEREKGRTCADRERMNEGMNGIFRRAASLRLSDPAAPEAQALVRDWQGFISKNCYSCTDEILAGLGAMYTQDERFRENLDRFGEGTAAFLSAAIREYCKGQG